MNSGKYVITKYVVRSLGQDLEFRSAEAAKEYLAGVAEKAAAAMVELASDREQAQREIDQDVREVREMSRRYDTRTHVLHAIDVYAEERLALHRELGWDYAFGVMVAEAMAYEAHGGVGDYGAVVKWPYLFMAASSAGVSIAEMATEVIAKHHKYMEEYARITGTAAAKKRAVNEMPEMDALNYDVEAGWPLL